MALNAEIIFAEWQRIKGERWRVRISSVKGRPTIDVRLFFQLNDGRWLPTKKGICLGIQSLEKLADGVALALEYARRQELVALSADPPKWK